MKIAIDVRVLMNEKYSGVSWYAFNLLNALFAADQTNEYVLFYNSRKAVKLPAFDFPNVSYRGFHYPNKLFNLSLNFLGWPKLDRLVGGCDAFLTPNLHFVSWSDKCHKVIVVHDLSFLAYPEFFTWRRQWWHKLIMRRQILRQADVIIADSISTKNDLVDLLKMPTEKIQVAYPAATIKSADENKIYQVKNKYNLPEKYFLFVGTIEPRKNLLGIMKAIEQLPADVKLVVAGEWGWKTKKLRLESQKHQDRIIFLGYVDESDKAALYQNAIALVYPSFYEGFGLPILEAMTVGCPVIAGNNSSQGEVLGDAGLLVDPFNINEIRQAMELMLTNHELRNEFINRGFKQAEKFKWQKTAEQIKTILKNLAK